MPYIPKDQIVAAREMDLLTYLRRFEPEELVHIGGDTYATRTHDSLKISNGKWCWWSRNIGGTTALDYAHTGSFSSYKVEHTGYSHFRREYGHFSGGSRREGVETAPDCIGGSYLCLRCRQRRDRFCGTGSAAYGTKVDRRQTPCPYACLHAAGGTVVAFGRHAGTVCLSAEGDPGWYRDLRAFGSVFSVPAPQVFLREDVYAFTYAGKGFVCRI